MKRSQFTPHARAMFMEALAATGNVTAASASIGFSRRRMYEIRKEDQTFAEEWDDAEEVACDALESEARRRAKDGVTRPLVSAGKVVKDDEGNPIILTEYSDTLMLALLKAHRPQKFRERYELSGDAANPVRFIIEGLDKK